MSKTKTLESQFRFSYFYNESSNNENINIITSVILNNESIIKPDESVQPLVIVADSVLSIIDVLEAQNTLTTRSTNLTEFYGDWFRPSREYWEIKVPDLLIFATYEIDREIIKTILESKNTSILFITDQGHFFKHFDRKDFEVLNQFLSKIDEVRDKKG